MSYFKRIFSDFQTLILKKEFVEKVQFLINTRNYLFFQTIGIFFANVVFEQMKQSQIDFLAKILIKFLLIYEYPDFIKSLKVFDSFPIESIKNSKLEKILNKILQFLKNNLINVGFETEIESFIFILSRKNKIMCIRFFRFFEPAEVFILLTENSTFSSYMLEFLLDYNPGIFWEEEIYKNIPQKCLSSIPKIVGFSFYSFLSNFYQKASEMNILAGEYEEVLIIDQIFDLFCTYFKEFDNNLTKSAPIELFECFIPIIDIVFSFFEAFSKKNLLLKQLSKIINYQFLQNIQLSVEFFLNYRFELRLQNSLFSKNQKISLTKKMEFILLILTNSWDVKKEQTYELIPDVSTPYDIYQNYLKLNPGESIMIKMGSDLAKSLMLKIEKVIFKIWEKDYFIKSRFCCFKTSGKVTFEELFIFIGQNFKFGKDFMIEFESFQGIRSEINSEQTLTHALEFSLQLQTQNEKTLQIWLFVSKSNRKLFSISKSSMYLSPTKPRSISKFVLSNQK